MAVRTRSDDAAPHGLLVELHLLPEVAGAAGDAAALADGARRALAAVAGTVSSR